MRPIASLAGLVLALAAPLSAQGFPPEDWWRHLYDGEITHFERVPWDRIKVGEALQIPRPAPPRFQFLVPFAGRPGQAPEKDSEFLWSDQACLTGPRFITHNGSGMVVVSQDDAQIKVLDGASAITSFNWSGVNGLTPQVSPLVSVPPQKICLEWVQALGDFDLIRGSVNGQQSFWWARNTITYAPINGLALDTRQQVWVSNPDGIGRVDAVTGATAPWISAGTQTPSGSPFIPTAVACDPLDQLVYAASETAVYRVEQRSPTITLLGGDPDKAQAADGGPGAGGFERITGLAVHASGWILVVDNGRLRWLSPSGVISTPQISGFGAFGLDTAFHVVFDRDTALVTDPVKHVVWRVL